MVIKIFRLNKINNSMFGGIFIDDHYECASLENFEKMIPAGIYEAEFYDSPKNHTEVLLLKDVPNRSMIEIHIANYEYELEGCIAPGITYTNNMLLQSKLAFNLIINKAKMADSVKVHIYDTIS